MKAYRIVILVAALSAALFIFRGAIQAADVSFPVYFPNSKLIIQADVMNRTVYLPIKEILDHLRLQYTDSVALETLTIRAGSNQLVVTKNSGLMSYNGQIVLLPSKILREDNRWLAPVEFLTLGLERMTGMDFRYRPGTPRIYAGDVDSPELEMNAQTLGPITRLTLRCSVPLNVDLKRDNQRAILAIDRPALDPVRQRLDHRARMVRSIIFDDSDGDAKIVLDITREVTDMRLTGADNNRIFFLDLLEKKEPVTEAAPPLDVTPPPAAKPDVTPAERKVRVVVIDPGHGGMDTGAKSASMVEKDFTLAFARKLRTALQARLGTTVLLTRDSDVALDNEARSAVANNNQANLFVSLHAGYSANKLDHGSSVFVMKENFGQAFTTSAAGGRDQLFLPWYLGYRRHHQGSVSAANVLQEELSKAIPESKFAVRTAPLAVLSSATMPSVLLEIGNFNNPANTQTL